MNFVSFRSLCRMDCVSGAREHRSRVVWETLFKSQTWAFDRIYPESQHSLSNISGRIDVFTLDVGRHSVEWIWVRKNNWGIRNIISTSCNLLENKWNVSLVPPIEGIKRKADLLSSSVQDRPYQLSTARTWVSMKWYRHGWCSRYLRFDESVDSISTYSFFSRCTKYCKRINPFFVIYF